MGHQSDAFESIRQKLLLRKVSPQAMAACAFVLAALLAGAFFFLVTEGQTNSFVFEKSNAEAAAGSLETEAASSESKQAKSISVHVAGCVSNPGVYEIEEGSRVGDAVNMAGGPTEDADQNRINLARMLTDGEQIIMPQKASDEETGEGIAPGAVAGETSLSPGNPNAATKININTASAAELDAIPGVGPSLAQKIASEREANGPFKKVDDLTRVSGIGEKKLEAMREYITVG